MVKSLSPSSSVKMIPKLTAPVFTKKNNSVSFINLLEKTKPKKARKPKKLIEDVKVPKHLQSEEARIRSSFDEKGYSMTM